MNTLKNQNNQKNQNKLTKEINEDVLNNIFSFMNETNYDYSVLFTNPYYKKNIHQKYIVENIYLLFLSFIPLQQYINDIICINESNASSLDEIYEYLSICYNKNISYIKKNIFTKKQLFNFFKDLSENIDNIIINREKKYVTKYKNEYNNIMKDMNY